MYSKVPSGPQYVFWLVTKLLGKSHGGNPGTATVPLGMAAAAIQHLEAEAIDDGVALGFVDLDHHVFVVWSVIVRLGSTSAQSKISGL